jgi:hypothetical protein
MGAGGCAEPPVGAGSELLKELCPVVANSCRAKKSGNGNNDDVKGFLTSCNE